MDGFGIKLLIQEHRNIHQQVQQMIKQWELLFQNGHLHAKMDILIFWDKQFDSKFMIFVFLDFHIFPD